MKSTGFAMLAGAMAMTAMTVGAATPVAVWDGAMPGFKFDVRTRTVGSCTYTLNLNAANMVAGDGSFVQIGSEDQKTAVTITADAAGAFGTAGKVTVAMKCSNLNLSDNVYRGLIGLLADEGGYCSGDNNVKIGIATGWNFSYGAGVYTSYFANGEHFEKHESLNSTAYTTSEQTICMTYDSASGTTVYRNGSRTASCASLKYSGWLTPVGIALGGMDKDGSTRVYAQTGMKILAVAVFTNCLSAAEAAAYEFPSETSVVEVSTDTSVSAINGMSLAKDLELRVADGVTITGDATFATATNVQFVCDGSFTVKPPAGNEAAFDFSRVTGRPVIEYTALPTVGGNVFTSTAVPSFVADHAQWTGVISLKNFAVTDFTANSYGNESSVVRIGGITGWLRAPGNYPYTNTVPVEIAGTVTINNGNSANDSNPNRCTVFRKLLGSGTLFTDSNAERTVIVIHDASDFTGSLGLSKGKFIAFGEAMPDYATFVKTAKVGQIIVKDEARVTVANGAFWWATGGIKVDGELCASSLNRFGGGTTITTSGTGVFTLTSTGNGDVNETDVDYGRIIGTGTLKYDGKGWRAVSTNNFPIGMALENEQQDDLLFARPGITNVVGSLAGTCKLQGNYVNSSAARYLRVLQDRDATWAGTIAADSQSRLGGLIVAPGVSTAGTLTLSGDQATSMNGAQTAKLEVETGAKAHLIGTWKGPVNVCGEFSGTGTIVGDLTLADGATFAVSDPEHPLTVTGNVTARSVTIILPEGCSLAKPMLVVSGETDLSSAEFIVRRGADEFNGNVGVIKNDAGGLLCDFGQTTLNGETQGTGKTLQLVNIFGSGALSENGVTFKIGGIDAAGGEIALDVSPSVAAGSTLSVMGKRELGDRWRRIMANPEGTSVTIGGDDFAANRFFQIRAEEGVKAEGYAVSAAVDVGGGEGVTTKSHITSASVNGDIRLFSLTFGGGEDSDYANGDYEKLTLEIVGVRTGTALRLTLDGVAQTAHVDGNGCVMFDGLVGISRGSVVSVDVIGNPDSEVIDTTIVSNRAGIVSCRWGDGETEAVLGGVTNVCTLMAYKPVADDGILEGGDKGGYRIPAMAKATNGVVVALYDCRYERVGADLPNEIDIAENWSGDCGVTWTKPHIGIDVSNDGYYDKIYNIGDPCVLYDPAANRFWCMGITGDGLFGSRVEGASVSDVVLYTRGVERNATWMEWKGGPDGNARSVKQTVLDSLAEALGDAAIADENRIRGVLQGPGHGFVQRNEVTDRVSGEVIMPKGALVFPMQYFPVNTVDTQDFALYSTDGGDTWTATALTPTNTPAGKDCYAQEGCVVELDDGTWEYMAKYGKYGTNYDSAYGGSIDDDARRDCRLFFRSWDFKTWKFDGYHPSKSIRSQGSCLWLGDKVKAANGGVSLYAACFSTWGKYKTGQRRGGLKLFFGRDTSSEAGSPGITWDCGEIELRREHTEACSYNSMAMFDDWTLGILFESCGHIYLRKVDLRTVLRRE